MPKNSSFPREQKCDLFPLFPLYPRKQSRLAVIFTVIPSSATFLNPADIVFVNQGFSYDPSRYIHTSHSPALHKLPIIRCTLNFC